MRGCLRYPLVSTLAVLSCLAAFALPVAAAPARQTAARVVYVALGVWDADGYGTDDPQTQSMPAQLARHLPPGARYFNASTGTEILEQAMLDQVPFALSVHPTLVTIGAFGWVNLARTASDLDPEAYPRVGFSDFMSDLDRVLAAFQRLHARVFISNVPDMLVVTNSANGGFGGTLLEVQGNEYNAAIAATGARHGAVVVDLYAASHLLWPHPELQADAGQGLNARGNAVLASVYYRTMHSRGAL
jgi:hypothetical protein